MQKNYEHDLFYIIILSIKMIEWDKTQKYIHYLFSFGFNDIWYRTSTINIFHSIIYSHLLENKSTPMYKTCRDRHILHMIQMSLYVNIHKIRKT